MEWKQTDRENDSPFSSSSSSPQISSTSSSSSSSAVNPETGEVDWDCPCLAEALKPPCGDAFKAAFSCFVKSTTEPKGEDCMNLFIEMQKCYLAHPEIYAPSTSEERTADS